MANGYMDIMKWKKVVSEAKKADKYLDKVRDWEEDDNDFDDDVSIQDAWEWGTKWIDSWYDTVVVNGLYELNGKKVHIIHKEFCNDSRDFGGETSKMGLINEISKWGFDGGFGISIDDRDDVYNVSKTYWFVVANIDGVYNLILPYRNGHYKPKKDNVTDFDRYQDGDYVEYKFSEFGNVVEGNWDERVSWLGDGIISDCSYDYDLSWANMKRIA